MKYNTFVDYICNEGNSALKHIEAAYNALRHSTLNTSSADISSNADVAIAHSKTCIAINELSRLHDLLNDIFCGMMELNSNMEPPLDRVFLFDDKGNIEELRPGSDEAMAALAAIDNVQADQDASLFDGVVQEDEK